MNEEKLSKLEELFLPLAQTWDCYNDEPEKENNPKKCADLAKEIAIDFEKFVYENTQDSHVKDLYIYLGLGLTREQLFDKFIVDYGKD